MTTYSANVADAPADETAMKFAVSLDATTGRPVVLPANHDRFKRVVDLALAVVIGILTLPLIAVIAVLIKLGSRGPVFYCHRRVGRRGGPFMALKFRTMVTGADQMLEQCLQEKPEYRAQWQENHKLQDDPRVTRVGALLRKTSLDELPQVWNVVKGEMSLVGPRPIVDDESGKYGKTYPLYLAVKPGITGLWQISGRNDTTYRQRVCLDAYYVRNWTLLLDLYILLRTPLAVAAKTGAY